MKATILDLRYKMKHILKALERNEKITILYHGKEKGILIPGRNEKKINAKDHPFFGMNKREEKSVEEQINELREPRNNAF